MYDYFVRGAKTYFIYNGKHYYTDNSLGESWKYHKFEINMREYQMAYRSEQKNDVNDGRSF